MNDQAQSEEKRTSRRKGTRYLRRLGTGLAAFLGLLLAGYIYESRAEAADAKTYSPAGQLVDVGGHRLHINCSGSGSPTVVIDAGLGDWSISWGSVQSEVARATRVCTYDRAGVGWSEAGPLPRDAAEFARELHTLLQNAGVPGPYVMVGHSLGGLGVRVFVHEYAAETGGVVLIESMNPGQLGGSPSEARSQSNPQSRFYSLLTVSARFGLVRLLAKPLGLVLSVPPNEAANYSRSVVPQNMQAFANEARGLQASAAQAAAVQGFGDLPLIVLTARRHTIPGWQEWQTELLQLSSNSQQLFAENSGHNVHVEEPDAAVAAILQMVRQVRQTANQ